MKINIFFTPVLLLFSSLSLHAQSWSWAKSLGSPNNSTTVKTLRPYTGKRALVSGSFAAPSLSLGAQTLANAGQDDGYAAIVDETGQYSWAARFGGSGRDVAVDAAAAPNGDFAVAGNFTSISINIGGTNFFNSGETDAFIAKYNPDKTLAWARKIGSAEIDEASNVVVDAGGSTYVSGQVLDKFTLSTQYVFLRKYDAAGNLVWEQKGVTQGGIVQITAMTLDQNQQVYLCGWLWGTVNFGNTSLKCDTSYAAYILKYSPSGAVLDTYFNPSLDKINSVQVHGNTLYCCAERKFGCLGWGWPLSHSKVHLLQLDADLNTVWHQTAGGTESCLSLDIAQSVSVDDNGNAYVTGYFFSDTLVFAGQTLLNVFNINYYYPEIFVFKYSPAGEPLWAKSLGGIHSDEGTGILAFGDDQFYLGGNFESDPVAFGPYNLRNTSSLDSIHVHLSPSRYGRKTMGFLAVFDKNVSSIRPEPALGQVDIFPNPATDHLVLRLKVPAPSPLVLQISSPDGRVLRQSVYSGPMPEIREDLTALPPGLYFVVLRTANGQFSGTFVKG